MHNKKAFFDRLVTGDKNGLRSFKTQKVLVLSKWNTSKYCLTTFTSQNDFFVCYVDYSRNRSFWSTKIRTNYVGRPLLCTNRSSKSIFNWKTSIDYQQNMLYFPTWCCNCTRRTSQKYTELGWVILNHPPYSPDITPSEFHLFRPLQHFRNEKKIKIWMILKMPSPDILLKSQLFFIDPVLKVSSLDGKRLLITLVTDDIID